MSAIQTFKYSKDPTVQFRVQSVRAEIIPHRTIHLASPIVHHHHVLMPAVTVVVAVSWSSHPLDVPHRGVDPALRRHGHQLLAVDRHTRGAATRLALRARLLVGSAGNDITAARPLRVVVDRTSGGQVGVVDGGVDRDRGGSTSVLVGVLVEQGVDVVIAKGGLVQQHVVVDGASGTLESVVAAQEEVVLERVGDAALDQSARQSVAVLVALVGEEADVVTL